jgi:hypothetical protein
MKLLTRVFAREEREKVLEVERQLNELTATVDEFYALLGPRHWIYHQDLSVEKVKAANALTPDEAERALIEMYQDADALRFMIGRLNRHEPLRARMDLIEKARVDYQAKRFYSTVLVLLTVMDGFVNDLEPARRRGLHARDSDELDAWDSVVGHHMGLASAHSTFVRGTYKTSNEPVTELQRHGIIHGTLLDYDNAVVATKAWNRLFAVADWATSLEEMRKPLEPDPSWRDVIKQINRNTANKKALAEWRPRTVEASDPAFEEEEICVRTAEYLGAWKARNYGAMVSFLSPALREDTHGQTAGEIRAQFDPVDLDAFSLARASFTAAGACEVDVDLVVDGEQRAGRLRWIRETSEGTVAMPTDEGEWFVYLWDPWTILARAESGNDDSA